MNRTINVIFLKQKKIKDVNDNAQIICEKPSSSFRQKGVSWKGLNWINPTQSTQLLAVPG